MTFPSKLSRMDQHVPDNTDGLSDYGDYLSSCVSLACSIFPNQNPLLRTPTEKQRLAHIKRNQEMLVRLGIIDAKEELAGPADPTSKKARIVLLVPCCMQPSPIFSASQSHFGGLCVAQGPSQAAQLPRRAGRSPPVGATERSGGGLYG